ncbi:MAG: Gfo/Idh/MocA family protein [Cellulosilyticaceae bacterium]
MTLKFGIIGAGNIAHKFCEAVKLVEGATVEGVASRTPGKAKSFAEENQVALSYDCYEALLENPNIDVVYIATTHNFHFENAMQCIAYKKHILCEKCFVLTQQQAEEVFEAAKKQQVFVMEAMWSRFLPAINKAKEWIVNGEIGAVEVANCMIGFKASNDMGNRIVNPELAGGAMYDIGVYAIEIMTYLIDQSIHEVQTMCTYAATGVDKVDNITLKFERCIANLQCVVTANCPNALYIYGTEGYIHIPNMHYTSECFLYRENEDVEHFSKAHSNGFEYQIEEVVRCIQKGQLESNVMPHKDTIACARIFDQCLGTK